MVNRVIGILVLLALGVLISPMLFNHHELTLQAEAKIRPAFPVQIAQNENIVPRPVRDRAPVRLSHAKISKEPSAYIVHVASFKAKATAVQMINQLRAQGFNAFLHLKNSTLGEETQVFVGPEPKREAAESLAAKLARDAKVAGVVKSYRPLAV
jgi:cell division septation protein DedD